VLEDPIQELDEMIAATQVVERSSNEKIALLIIMTGMIIASIVLGCTSKRIVAAFGIGVMFSFLLACGNGANDICNSVGTSVGCGAMTLKQAVVWGSIFEFLGAITMGQFVSKEISKGVLEATDYVGDDQDLFALCMVSVLVAAALTTLLATFYGFPISATHGIIGGLVSVGMAAKGTASIGWGVLGKMVIGWLLSPLLASTVSASLFLIINKAVLKTSDPFRAAQKWRPIFLWATLAVCAAFILIKGPKPIKNLWLSTGVWLAVVIAIIFGGVVTALYLGVKKATAKTDGKSAKGAEISFEKVESGLGEVVIAKESDSDGDGSDIERSNSRKDFVKKMSEKDEAEDEEDVERDDSEFQQETQEQKENKKKMEELFTPLLVISALCVAFAHGANDVGNAVGPLAVIFQVYDEGSIPANGKPNIPMWSLFMGACGFVFGIVFLGSKTIATVGTKITKLTPTRSYATQIGAAIAVLASSVVGLPVSTSHCLVGSVVGVGLAQKFLGEHNSLSLSVLKKIVLGWAVTIPLAMLVAVIVFLPFKGLFTE
jgi:phosphate/sulfate permease